MENGKRMATSGLNAVMMVSFAFKAAKFLGVGSAILMPFLEAFLPNPDPGPQPVTEAELKEALNNLNAQIIQDLFNAKLDDFSTDVSSHYRDFNYNCADMKNLTINTRHFVFDITLKNPSDTTVSTLDSYFAVGTSPTLHALENYRTQLESTSKNDPLTNPLDVAEHYTTTTGLYCLISSLTASYLKAALMWEWNKNLLKMSQYDKYQDDLTFWNAQVKANPNYKNSHPLSAIAARYPGLPSSRPDEWEKWIKTSPAALRLLGNPASNDPGAVQEMFNYCVLEPATTAGGATKDGLCVSMRKHWDLFEAEVASYDKPIPSNTGLTVAVMIDAVKMGAARAGNWKPFLDQYALAKVTEDDITSFETSIKAWRTVTASVRFQRYTSQPKQTFADVAQLFYSDPSLGPKILQTNQDQFAAGDTTLRPGMILNIYDQDVLDYAPTPAHK